MPKKGYTGICLKTEVAQLLRESKNGKHGLKRLSYKPAIRTVPAMYRGPSQDRPKRKLHTN